VGLLYLYLYPTPSTTRAIRSTTVLLAGKRHLKRRRETLKNILTGKPERKGSMLKWSTKKQNGETCAEFAWFRIETSGGLL
jgi:hypothetical protein